MLTFLKYVEWYFAKAKSTGFSHPVIQPSYYMYMGVYGLWVQSVACLFWGADTLWNGLEDTWTTKTVLIVYCGRGTLAVGKGLWGCVKGKQARFGERAIQRESGTSSISTLIQMKEINNIALVTGDQKQNKRTKRRAKRTEEHAKCPG